MDDVRKVGHIVHVIGSYTAALVQIVEGLRATQLPAMT